MKTAGQRLWGSNQNVCTWGRLQHCGLINTSHKYMYMYIDSSAAEVPVKFQSNWTILTTNLAASRLHEILQIRCLIGYWNRAQVTRHYLSLSINSCNPYNTTPQWVKPILSLTIKVWLYESVVNQGLTYEFTFDNQRPRVHVYILTATVQRSYFVDTINRSKLSSSNSLT